jgi:hypothetical protein
VPETLINQHCITVWAKREVRTGVTAAAGCWPKRSALAEQARAVPEYLTIAAGPLAARNFFVRTEHCANGAREELPRSARICAQIEATSNSFFSTSQGKARLDVKEKERRLLTAWAH